MVWLQTYKEPCDEKEEKLILFYPYYYIIITLHTLHKPFNTNTLERIKQEITDNIT